MLTLGLLVAFFMAPSASGQCTQAERAAGLCSISNTGSTVEVGATRPGGTRESGGGGGRSERDPAVAPTPAPGDPCAFRCGYSVGIIRQPTLTDIASFAPAPQVLTDEPDGVGIVGMPVNFVVPVAAHEATGTLFELPVTVRFTPASVTFVHGDGTSRTSATGGRTWADLGLAQFSATPTSHAYAQRGTYSAFATVNYAAEVNFGNGWIAVSGLLEIPTAASTIQIVEARTALVERTCAENPAGPGC